MPHQRLRRGSSRLLALVLVVASGCASSSVKPETLVEARAEAQRIHHESSAPAFAVAVVVDGTIVMSEGFGTADLTSGVAASEATAFRIGSVSKLFTSLVLVRMVERGTIRLDHPVARYVAEFSRPDVTIGQLAHHLGGIRHYARDEYVNRQHYASVGSSLEKFIDDPLVAEPGEKYVYSSYGYNLLGAALEKAAGVPFEEAVDREVLEPFGMQSTGVELSGSAQPAGFYGKSDSGEISESTAMDLSDRVPSGGYLSTAEDLARFLIGIMDLPASTRAILFAPGVTSDGATTEAAMGWRVGSQGGRELVHHGGSSMGGRAFVLAYPQQRLGVVLLANLSFAPFGEKEAMALAEPFVRELAGPQE